MRKRYHHARFRAPLTAALLLAGFGGLHGTRAIAALPPRLSAPIYADYDSELREAAARADGIKHVDSPALIQKLLAGNIRTYAYLVWHENTDWDDFRLEFLPDAQVAGIDVRASLPRLLRMAEFFGLPRPGIQKPGAAVSIQVHPVCSLAASYRSEPDPIGEKVYAAHSLSRLFPLGIIVCALLLAWLLARIQRKARKPTADDAESHHC